MIFSEPINRKLPCRKAGDKKKRFPIYYEKQNRNCKDVSGIIKDSWCLLLPWRKCQLIRLWCCYQFSESNSFQAHLIMLVITFSFARALRSAVNTYFKINKGIKTSMKHPNFHISQLIQNVQCFWLASYDQIHLSCTKSRSAGGTYQNIKLFARFSSPPKI